MTLSAQPCVLFSDFIENNFLVDLPLEGASFTWFRDSEPKSMSRIDRMLVIADWEDHFGNGVPEGASSSYL